MKDKCNKCNKCGGKETHLTPKIIPSGLKKPKWFMVAKKYCSRCGKFLGFPPHDKALLERINKAVRHIRIEKNGKD